MLHLLRHHYLGVCAVLLMLLVIVLQIVYRKQE